MIHLTHPHLRAAGLAAFLCFGLMVAGLMTRPIFPVDETRYLTVAWEMHQSGNWILPTLNGEAYHHKPPVLFWMINILWAIFGVSQQAAMIVPYLTSFAVLVLSGRLAGRMFPQHEEAPLLTVALLGGCMPFVIYGNLIMFDLLLTVAVIAGVTAIWDFYHTRQTRHIVWFALAVGAGLLIKGPAALLHMAPALLAVRYWMKDQAPPASFWLPRMLFGLWWGIAIALCWAIPAAFEGGKEFTEKIFYGQTTGRMVNAFDHSRPVYWYLPFIPIFVMPWIFAPGSWRGLKSAWGKTSENRRFLAVWIGTVFAAFSLISGKQVHYLIPLLPAIMLVIAGGFLALPHKLLKRDVLPILIGANLLALLPIAARFFADDLRPLMPGSVHLETAFRTMPVLPSAALGIGILLLGITVIRVNKASALSAAAVAMMLLMCSFHFAAKSSFYPNYDLSQISQAVQENLNDRPLAFANNNQGQIGFLARLTRPPEQITEDKIRTWLGTHPDGLVLVYTRKPEDFAGYDKVFEQPYRMTNYFMLLQSKDRPAVSGGN